MKKLIYLILFLSPTFVYGQITSGVLEEFSNYSFDVLSWFDHLEYHYAQKEKLNNNYTTKLDSTGGYDSDAGAPIDKYIFFYKDDERVEVDACIRWNGQWEPGPFNKYTYTKSGLLSEHAVGRWDGVDTDFDTAFPWLNYDYDKDDRLISIETGGSILFDPLAVYDL